MRLCVLGEYLIDFTPVGTNDRGLPLYAQNPGGAPANVACACAKLGVSAGVISKVSTDAFGQFLLRYLKQLEIVDLRGVCLGDEPTGLAFVTLDESGDRDFVFFRNGCADSSLRTEDVDVSLIEECDVFHFSSVSLVAEPSRSATLFAARKAKELGKTVSFDINYRPLLWNSDDEAREQAEKAMVYADLVKVSEDEAVTFGGSIEGCAEYFRKFGVGLTLVTLGSQGSSFYKEDCQDTVPTFKVDTVDTTGAGDNFMGAFLAALVKRGKKPVELENKELCEMLRYANAAGAICATGYGAIAPQATEESIRSMLNGD